MSDRVLWVDPGNGAAGDMLLAALLDAGASVERVLAGLSSLDVEPIALELEPVRRHGLRALHAQVRAADSDAHRHVEDVLALVRAAALPEPVRRFATATFERLGDAEATVHGVSRGEVHLHEVGALDAIADVVGCALALHDLGVLDAPARVVGPVAAGSGTVRTAHGPMPVPVPAVVELLRASGAPLAAHPATMELCTPTGAALLAQLATGWGPPPAMTLDAVGVGAGTADPPGHPNVLRVLVGRAGAAAPRWLSTELHLVDATVDDLDPRIWPDLLDRLREAGAADAWCTAVLMRGGRPGQLLSVLVDPQRLDLVCELVFTETTTLGVRVHPVQRRSLRRDQVIVRLAGHEIPVKRGLLGDRPVTIQPEYAPARDVARRLGRPIAEVLHEARDAAGAEPT